MKILYHLFLGHCRWALSNTQQVVKLFSASSWKPRAFMIAARFISIYVLLTTVAVIAGCKDLWIYVSLRCWDYDPLSLVRIQHAPETLFMKSEREIFTHRRELNSYQAIIIVTVANSSSLYCVLYSCTTEYLFTSPPQKLLHVCIYSYILSHFSRIFHPFILYYFSTIITFFLVFYIWYEKEYLNFVYNEVQ